MHKIINFCYRWCELQQNTSWDTNSKLANMHCLLHLTQRFISTYPNYSKIGFLYDTNLMSYLHYVPSNKGFIMNYSSNSRFHSSFLSLPLLKIYKNVAIGFSTYSKNAMVNFYILRSLWSRGSCHHRDKFHLTSTRFLDKKSSVNTIVM